MDEVILDALAGAEHLDAISEGTDQRRQLFLLETLDRAGGDVDQPGGPTSLDGAERLDLGRLGIDAASKDVALHAEGGQLRRDLPHVDVHTAGLTATQRRERRGVH